MSAKRLPYRVESGVNIRGLVTNHGVHTAMSVHHAASYWQQHHSHQRGDEGEAVKNRLDKSGRVQDDDHVKGAIEEAIEGDHTDG